MQPPITHYKDEVTQNPDSSVENLINQEINKGVSSYQGTTPKLKVIPVVKQDVKKQSTSSIVNAFRQKLATNLTSVELPSIGKTIEFKEIDTKEQKELSKIALENDSRADIMYCSMLGLINRLACEKNFDIRDYTEFERISILLNLQQMNKPNREITYTCQKCGKENSYSLDTFKLIKEFNKAYRQDIDFEVESGNRRFIFTIGWPKVSTVEEFFKNYYRKYDNSSRLVKDTMNNLSQIEYITMFIKRITLVDKNDSDDSMTANLEDMSYSERVQLVDCLPQMIVFDDDNGVVEKIISQFVNPMNDCFKYRECAFCGSEQDGQMANLTDFMSTT